VKWKCLGIAQAIAVISYVITLFLPTKMKLLAVNRVTRSLSTTCLW